MNKLNQQAAFSLIEILFSLLLGSLLLVLVSRHYLLIEQHTQETSRSLTTLSDLTLISDLIRTSVQQAGFTPCLATHALIAKDEHHQPLAPAIAIDIGEHQALQVTRMNEPISVIRDVSNNQSITLEANRDFKPDDKILVADCQHAEVNIIEHASRHGALWSIHLKAPLHLTYQAPIYVGEWLTERFFVAANRHGEPTFYYQTNRAEALSQSIQAMSVHFIPGRMHALVNVDFELADNQHWLLEAAIRQ